eukprot:scaffold127222_cov32-Tisochrysis_lutea.AAC.6
MEFGAGRIHTCCSDTSAIAFCGDAIGVSIPPRLQEKAKPRRRALAKRESVGPSCSSGVTTVSNSTGAVTFEMVAERSKPSSMICEDTAEYYTLGMSAGAATEVL